MKPITNPIPSRIKVRFIVALLLGICLTSCATSSRPPQAATKPPPTATPAASANWVKISSNPPTWYPRGTRTDCATDFRSGEWVATGDRQGSRYFIPVHVTGAIPRQTLVKEALAARAPGTVNRIAREDAEQAARSCLKTLFFLSPPGLLFATAYAITQMPSTPESGRMSGFGGMRKANSIWASATTRGWAYHRIRPKP